MNGLWNEMCEYTSESLRILPVLCGTSKHTALMQTLSLVQQCCEVGMGQRKPLTFSIAFV
jgi:hypothetical protein